MLRASAIRDLYVHICDVLSGCENLLALLDAEKPIRRMQEMDDIHWVNILTYGRATRRRVQPESPGLYYVTVTLEPYLRGEAEASTMGDLLLADVEEILMQIFDVEQHGRGDCTYPATNIIVLKSEFDDFQSEPGFDHDLQAWRMQIRFRFMVAVPTCRPVTTWCDECAAA